MLLLGIDIGGTKTSVCLGDEKGNITASERMPTGTPDGPERCIARMIDLARRLLSGAGASLGDISAVGLSAPGPVSLREQVMLEPPNMKGWVNVPLVRMFREAFGRPVFMNNDANACALAEYLFGGCRGTRNLVYLTMSTGLGAGFVVDGHVVQGVTDLAGEVGHHVLDINGPPCPCGQRGCWEIYCGGMNVANRLRERIVRDHVRTAILDLADGDPARIDFRIFVDAMKAGDAFAVDAWAEYVERLAQGIGTVIQFMNPEVIVLGTIAIHTGELLLAPVRERLPKYCWRHGREACRIVPSALGTRIGDLSALAVAIDGLS
ncbi:MAG TPA: ROK family protein [Kiritimatiellia bacterium]|nr:ROK family protein [Kiritimatiellia bacterium]